MTCIVGYVEKATGKVYIGGDSAGVDSRYNISNRLDSKIFKNGKMIFGYTSSFRMGQLLRYSLKIPNKPKNMNDYEYMCTIFISAVIECFKNNGYLKKEKEEFEGGNFIVGFNHTLYEIHEDFQVGIVADNYNSCGCGEVYAKGALKILDLLDISTEDKIIRALETAEYFSAGVRKPFNIISL